MNASTLVLFTLVSFVFLTNAAGRMQGQSRIVVGPGDFGGRRLTGAHWPIRATFTIPPSTPRPSVNVESANRPAGSRPNSEYSKSRASTARVTIRRDRRAVTPCCGSWNASNVLITLCVSFSSWGVGQGVPSLLAFAQIPRQNVTNYVFLLIDSRRSSDRVTAGSESGRSRRRCRGGWFLKSEMDARISFGSPICQGRRILLLATWSLFCTHKSAKCSSTAQCCTGSKQPVWTGSGDAGKLDGIRQEVGPGAVNSEVRGPFGFL
jgi:hypothetical protein